MSKRIIDYYSDIFSEDDRLSLDLGPLEWLRTLDIFERFLPPTPAVVLDVGGGTGVYSCWLLERRYEVHLVELVPQHVEIAKKAMAKAAGTSKWSAVVGTGERLDCPDERADVVLLMGPLYHLQEREDRLAVLREARRVLRPGGVVACAAISKYASYLDGLRNDFIRDPEFRKIIGRDLQCGRHDNDTNKPEYFTTAYFQHPEELEQEMTISGFVDARIIAVEGILWAARDIESLRQNGDAWQPALDFMKEIEEEKSIIGVSPHLLGIAKKSNN